MTEDLPMRIKMSATHAVHKELEGCETVNFIPSSRHGHAVRMRIIGVVAIAIAVTIVVE